MRAHDKSTTNALEYRYIFRLKFSFPGIENYAKVFLCNDVLLHLGKFSFKLLFFKDIFVSNYTWQKYFNVIYVMTDVALFL